MFRVKSKISKIIKIKDIEAGKVLSIGKNWVYLDNDMFLNSKEIKSNLSNLEVETDTPKFKKKVLENQDMKIENQNGMFTTSPVEKETPSEIKNVEPLVTEEKPLNKKDIIAVAEKPIDKKEENNKPKNVEKLIEAEIIENVETIEAEENNEIKEKKDKKTKEDIIKNVDKDINKIEKTSRRGRKPKSEATK